MHIVHVSTNSDRAGAPRYVEQLALQQIEHGHEVTVFFGAEGPIQEALASKGVPTAIISGMRSKISPLADLKCQFQLRNALQTAKPTIVHAHSAKAGMQTRIACRALRLPCVYTVHGLSFGDSRPLVNGLAQRVVEAALSKTASQQEATIFVSEQDALLALKTVGLKGTVVLNGIVDDQKRADLGADGSLVMIARVSPAKDHLGLARALRKCSSRPQVTLLGFGTDSPSFTERFLSISGYAPNKVRFLGEVDNVGEFLTQATMLALISKYEGTPLCLIEGLRAGLPLIASNVGGNGKIVQGSINGFLVKPNNDIELANAIDEMASTELRRRFGAASRKLFEQHFTAEKNYLQVDQVYHRLLTRSDSSM